MAAPSYTTDLTTILLEFPNTTNWTALGGGAAGLNAPETDYFLQGNNCISKNAFASANKGMIYNAGSTTIATGDAVWMWITHHTPGSLDVESGTPGGIQILIGSGTGDFDAWDVRGSDTIDYGAPWICAVADPDVTADDVTGTPSGTYSHFGALWNLPSGGPTKGAPNGIDAFRHGGRMDYTDGDSGNGFANFLGAAVVSDAASARYGQLQSSDAGIVLRGRHGLGTASTSVDFRQTDGNILFDRLPNVVASFNEIELIHASSNVEWTRINFTQLGATGSNLTASRFRITLTDDVPFTVDSCTFKQSGIIVLDANSDFTNCIFQDCDLITQNGATFTGCNFLFSNTGTQDITVDTVAEITNCNFVSVGFNYAMEGFSTAGSYTLTGNTYTGYAATDGSTGSEVLHVLATTGTVTLNIVGGDSPSVHTAGATIVKVINPVNTDITCKDAAGANIENARVLVVAADGTGPFPFEESISITRSGATATVTHTAHGLATNDKVMIKGANQPEYNCVATITVTSVNAYTYTVSGTPDTPATGTIIATYVALEGLTNASGLATATDAFGSNQPITGHARKGGSAPFYKTTPITGTIDSTAGFAVTLTMALDQ